MKKTILAVTAATLLGGLTLGLGAASAAPASPSSTLSSGSDLVQVRMMRSDRMMMKKRMMRRDMMRKKMMHRRMMKRRMMHRM